MALQDSIEGKEQWRVHMARLKAFPPDYWILYEEMQSSGSDRSTCLTGPCSPGSSSSSRKASSRARGSWNSSATMSPRSATTWSRTHAPMRTSTRSPSAAIPVRPKSSTPASCLWAYCPPGAARSPRRSANGLGPTGHRKPRPAGDSIRARPADHRPSQGRTRSWTPCCWAGRRSSTAPSWMRGICSVCWRVSACWD